MCFAGKAAGTAQGKEAGTRLKIRRSPATEMEQNDKMLTFCCNRSCTMQMIFLSQDGSSLCSREVLPHFHCPERDGSATLDRYAYPQFAEHRMATCTFSSRLPPSTQPSPRVTLSRRTTAVRSTGRLCMPVSLRTRRRSWRRRGRYEARRQLLRIPIRGIRRVHLVCGRRPRLIGILHWIVAGRIGHTGRILMSAVGRIA